MGSWQTNVIYERFGKQKENQTRSAQKSLSANDYGNLSIEDDYFEQDDQGDYDQVIQQNSKPRGISRRAVLTGLAAAGFAIGGAIVGCNLFQNKNTLRNAGSYIKKLTPTSDKAPTPEPSQISETTGRTFYISPKDNLAIKANTLQPSDTLILHDGIYSKQSLETVCKGLRSHFEPSVAA